MSLYHEAAAVLNATGASGESIKSQAFSKKGWKSEPKTLFALCTEAAKWSEILAEVIEKSDLLGTERQLSPTLALVLSHDLLLSRRGIALPPKHGLHIAVTQHKARLSAELTKVRLCRGFATLDALRETINAKKQSDQDGTITPGQPTHPPRWIRINTLRTTVDEQLHSTFKEYSLTSGLGDILHADAGEKVLHVDKHIPDLVAVPAHVDLAASKAYVEGKIIFQDKASCFPAYLLQHAGGDSDIVDACAAPGNKTTHLAAMMQSTALVGANLSGRIFAVEKDASRSETLRKLVRIAKAEDIVSVKANQDFLKLDPKDREFTNVTALLLDPSCSGSGIVGRDDVGITIHLPKFLTDVMPRGKKRKRRGIDGKGQSTPDTSNANLAAEEAQSMVPDDGKLEARLKALSCFQLRLLEQAMAFPAARRISYSTCSIHAEENEHVVVRALQSAVAVERGWRIMKRIEQVDGMEKWHCRGCSGSCRSVAAQIGVCDTKFDVEEVAEACIRCRKGTDDGTIGFFVAGFVREFEPIRQPGTKLNNTPLSETTTETSIDESRNEIEDEWEGFEDEDT